MYLDVGVRRFHRFINLYLSEQKHHYAKRLSCWGLLAVAHEKECRLKSKMETLPVAEKCDKVERLPITVLKAVQVCDASR